MPGTVRWAAVIDLQARDAVVRAGRESWPSEIIGPVRASDGRNRGVARRSARKRTTALLLVLTILGPGCGRITRHFSGGSTTRKGTLVVSPAHGPIGSRFTLTAAGFRPGEPMTFAIDPPNRTHFVGPPHVADARGSVSSIYTPQAGNPLGSYRVRAVGSRGTRADGHLTITSSPSTTSR